MNLQIAFLLQNLNRNRVSVAHARSRIGAMRRQTSLQIRQIQRVLNLREQVVEIDIRVVTHQGQNVEKHMMRMRNLLRRRGIEERAAHQLVNRAVLYATKSIGVGRSHHEDLLLVFISLFEVTVRQQYIINMFASLKILRRVFVCKLLNLSILGNSTIHIGQGQLRVLAFGEYRIHDDVPHTNEKFLMVFKLIHREQGYGSIIENIAECLGGHPVRETVPQILTLGRERICDLIVVLLRAQIASIKKSTHRFGA